MLLLHLEIEEGHVLCQQLLSLVVTHLLPKWLPTTTQIEAEL